MSSNQRPSSHSLAKLGDKIDSSASRQEQRAPCGLSGTAVSSLLECVYRTPLSSVHNTGARSPVYYTSFYCRKHCHQGGVKFYPDRWIFSELDSGHRVGALRKIWSRGVDKWILSETESRVIVHVSSFYDLTFLNSSCPSDKALSIQVK